VNNGDILTVCHLSDTSELDEALAKEGAWLKRSIDLERGKAFKALLISTPDKRAYLLLTAHHLCIDAVSWRILLDDLNQLLDNHFRGQENPLLKGGSFYRWAVELAASGRELFIGQKGDWIEMNRADTWSAYRPACWREIEKDEFVLSEVETDAIVCRIRKKYNLQTDEFLVIGLATALFDVFVREEIAVMLEGHGRVELFECIDASRTVGWFTSSYPVALKRPKFEGKDQYLLQMKEQLKRVRQGGIGYGVLSWQLKEIEPMRENLVTFNYLGAYDNSFDNAYFDYAMLESGPDLSQDTPFFSLVDMTAFIIQKRLHIEIRCHPDMVKNGEARSVTQRCMSFFKNAAAEYGTGEEQFLSPSDFSLVSLSQNELDHLLR
jgi:non-ribosomal peptide synthase protein (TIGR01720 family)